MTQPLFNADQLADILLQKEGRVTCGVLPARTQAQKISDVFAFHVDSGARGGRLGKILNDYFSRGKIVVYDTDYKNTTVDAQHPRCLRNALLELRYAGLNIAQVNAVNNMATQSFWISFMHDLKHLRSGRIAQMYASIEADYPGHFPCLDSRAVLGVSFCPSEDFGVAALPNCAFKPETESAVYPVLRDYMESWIRRDPDMLARRM